MPGLTPTDSARLWLTVPQVTLTVDNELEDSGHPLPSRSGVAAVDAGVTKHDFHKLQPRASSDHLALGSPASVPGHVEAHVAFLEQVEAFELERIACVGVLLERLALQFVIRDLRAHVSSWTSRLV